MTGETQGKHYWTKYIFHCNDTYSEAKIHALIKIASPDYDVILLATADVVKHILPKAELVRH